MTVSARLLLDNSAWVCLFDPAIPEGRGDEIADEIGEERLVVCLPFLLEAGYSARNAADYEVIFDPLGAMERLPMTEGIEARALDAHAQLVRIGHHRIPPVDLMIAAIAEHHHVGVLHYDADYDLLLEKTDLDFHSEWLMPPGSLN